MTVTPLEQLANVPAGVLASQKVIRIRSEEDFPPDVAGVRQLDPVQYWLEDYIPVASTLRMPDVGFVTFFGMNSAGSGLIYTGTGDLFKNLTYDNGFLVCLFMLMSAPTGRLYNVDGASTGFVTSFGCVFSDIDDFGIIKGVGFSHVFSNIQDVGQGLMADSNNGATFGRLNWLAGKNQVGAKMITIRGTHGNVQISSNFFTTNGANETIFNIEPTATVNAGIADGNGVDVSAGGTVFEPGSLDFSEPSWSFRNNPGVPDSEASVNIAVNGNVAVTTITAVDTFTPLNLGTAAANTDKQRWNLTDAVTGEIQYVGLEERLLTVVASITAVKAAGGSAVRCNFRVFIDRGAGYVDLPDVLDAPLEIKATIDSKTLITPVKIAPNDKIRIEVEELIDTDNIVVDTFSLSIF